MICLIKESQLRNKKNIITRIKSHISIINICVIRTVGLYIKQFFIRS
jgi:hypothetical protein